MKTINDYADLVKEKHALNKTLAPVETDLTSASRAYAIGQKFIYDGILYKAKTAIVQGAALVLNTNYEAADDFSSEIQTLTNNLSDEVETRAALGAHNLMSYDYVLPSSGGVTFTHNADGTFTVSGTATSQDASLLLKSIPAVPTGNYLISGFASVTNLNVNAVYLYKNDVYVASKSTAVVDNEIPLVIGTEDYDEIRIVIRRTTDDVACTGTLYPMLRRVTDSDPTYQPYAMTNRELTDIVLSLNGYMIQFGTVEIGRAVGLNTAQVTFPRRFADARNTRIWVSYDTSQPNNWIPGRTGVTSTGFTAELYNATSSAANDTSVQWFAIGKQP